ncbi:MAG: glycoside hydrolase family 2 TIM barrel-domain containing protein, partial [Anaerolineae bacterium]|nr:glycoside hydrolase family 2 TIM barrel-domain containing protein [Anaerolineae bacterium]
MRTFIEHLSRPVTILDGFWDFAFLGNVHPDQVHLPDINFTEKMAVPGCFDATPQFAGKRGLTAYRKELLITQPGRQRIAFDGVSHWCRVLINGNNLGEHVGGFVPFAFDFELQSAGWVELIVLVDNRFDAAQNPLHLDYFDWYQHGGIARSVALHALGNAWIEDVRVTTLSVDPPTVEIQVTLHADIPVTDTISVFVDEQEVMSEEVDVVDVVTLRFDATLEGAHLWSPEHPHLHFLRVNFGKDDRIERFGIRTIEVSTRKILLNGEPIRLLGFNRHELHVDFGHSFPDALLLNDIQLLKSIHCNFVRGSHYPQDPRFLDLCDEHGLLVWSEGIGWQHTEQHINDPNFMEAQKTHLAEMVQ